MRTAMLGAFLGALLAVGAWLALGRSPAMAQSPGGPTSESLITHAFPAGDAQHLVVIDPHTRAMAVYHVDPATGRVTLRSVRPFGWDLQINGFNVAKPTPDEIRSMLQPR
jgi:hypothetical protein